MSDGAHEFKACSKCSAIPCICPPKQKDKSKIDVSGPVRCKPTETQVGGKHYKSMTVQPAVFCELNGLSLLEGNIVKRICRWRNKGGLVDLRKIQHEVDLLIEIHEVK